MPPQIKIQKRPLNNSDRMPLKDIKARNHLNITAKRERKEQHATNSMNSRQMPPNGWLIMYIHQL